MADLDYIDIEWIQEIGGSTGWRSQSKEIKREQFKKQSLTLQEE